MKMSSHRTLARVDRVFNEAQKWPPEDQATFLASTCGADEELLREVESLLAAGNEMGEDFLENAVLSLADAPQELGEGSSIGAYRILREIGRGGMGKVYLAARDDDVYQQEVAIKILKRGLDTEEIVRRFRHEREVLARLDHPHIVRILDGGTTDDGRPYFVMEYVLGEPIDRSCDARQLSMRARLEIFREVCAAVAFAHQNLVVHRDLKPQNILINSRGEPKLLDFGIAKLLEPGQTPLTLAGTQPMTPGYASPEQISNGVITTASDVYSLGRLLYELLTGSDPYGVIPPGDSLYQRILEQEPQPPSRTPGCHHLAGDLDRIVLKALEKDPRRRYASVEQFSEDLDRYLRGLPVRARQATAGYRLGKFVRRHRTAVAVAVAMAVGVLGFCISMTVLWGQAVQEREKAERSKEQAVRERRRVVEITGLLVEVFQNPDPKVSQGEDLTARQLLDEYAETIDKGLEGDPETRAVLINAIGQAYLGLGLYDHAEPLLEESLRLRREIPNTNFKRLSVSLFNLADVRRAVDRNDDAAALAQEALEVLRQGGPTPSLARALNNQAILLKHQGDIRGAEEFYRESLAMKVRLFGEEHASVATGKHNLATALREQGKYDQAESLYWASQSLKIALYGEDSLEAMATLKGLALLLIDRGDQKAAEPMLRKVLQIRRRIYGPEHPKVGTVLVDLGFVLRLRQDYEEAERRYNEAMQIFIRRFGEDHSSVAKVLRHQALLLFTQGQTEEAEHAARRALEIFRQTKSAGHWQIAEAGSVLGACLRALGHEEEAATLLRRGYETLKAAKGDAARQTRQAFERLGQPVPKNQGHGTC